jgi:hypothetical protein
MNVSDIDIEFHIDKNVSDIDINVSDIEFHMDLQWHKL